MPSARTEEYLEAIFKIHEESQEPVSITRLAEHLGLSAASASEMVKRLNQAGDVDYSKNREITLTPKGQRQASRVIRRHRLAERLLTDFLGLGWERVHDEACSLEHAISPEVEERLASKLGNPATCPHGHPIPATDGTFPIRDVRRLSELKPGEKGRIVMVKEDDSQLLEYLRQLGMLLETELEVIETAPFGGPVKLLVGGKEEAVGQKLAENIMVTQVK